MDGLLFYDRDTDGSTFDPVIVESTGNEEFNEAALAAILQSRFEPAKLANEPIVGSFRVVFPFARAPGATSRELAGVGVPLNAPGVLFSDGRGDLQH